MESKSTKVTPTATSISSNTSTTTDKMNYALQVALQTMKERCIVLQRRVTSLEEDNQRLREGISTSSCGSQANVNAEGNIDVNTLRSQTEELQRQKEQLEEQISMVSNENRRLWSRLSKISKDQSELIKDDNGMAIASRMRDAAVSVGANQNLIRSKTFTQHSPNPHLRQKLISEGSLEEMGHDDDFDGSDASELGYPYGLQMEDGATNITETDTNVDAKHCMDGLQDLRREAMKQQQALNTALTKLKSRLALQPCPDCADKAAKKPEMADKSLETETLLGSEPVKRHHNDRSISTGHLKEIFNGHETVSMGQPARLNIIQEKLKADATDKTCPMCGKLYSSQVSFKAFQEHVEMHFIDEALDADASMDRQFEFISHAVGDF